MGIYKIMGRLILGLIVGLVMYYNPAVVVREKQSCSTRQIESFNMATPTESTLCRTKSRSTKNNHSIF